MQARLLTVMIFTIICVIQSTRASAAGDLRGGWQAESYLMKGGQISYPIRGQIIFSERDWTVLFFTMKDGKLVRGSGEGGYYEASGANLVFFHRFFAGPAFEAIPGLKAQEAAAQVKEPPVREETTYEIHDNRLTIHFGPSGNTLTWLRSSR